MPWAQYESMPSLPCFSIEALSPARTALLFKQLRVDTTAVNISIWVGHANYRPGSGQLGTSYNFTYSPPVVARRCGLPIPPPLPVHATNSFDALPGHANYRPKRHIM
jgi:hypothetical protein